MIRVVAALAFLLVAFVFSVSAQSNQPPVNLPPSANSKPAILDRIGIDQRLNQQVPLDLMFRDETGKEVQLKEYFGKKPVVLALIYYNCPMLCTLVLNGLVGSLNGMSFTVGKEFDVVAVSFDPRETPELATAKKKIYLQRYLSKDTEPGWHFLTGSEDSIKKLTQSVGFRYFYDKEKDQFAHASGIILITPEGKVSRYFYGVEYAPRDVKLGLIEASQNKIGSAVDQLLLLCYHYDPSTGRYSVLVLTLVRAAGVITVLSIIIFIIVMLRMDRKKQQAWDLTNKAVSKSDTI